MAGLSAPRDYSFLWKSEQLKDDNNRILTKAEVIDKIIERYEHLILELENLLDTKGLIDKCEVNAELVWQATLCYFADIVRLKQFHQIDHIAREKIYAYEAFWLLRHHPVQLVSQIGSVNGDRFGHLDSKTEQLVYVNEYAISLWLIKCIASKIYDDSKPLIQIDGFPQKTLDSPYAKNLANKIFYNFRYRAYTAETILLMLEAVLETVNFILDIT